VIVVGIAFPITYDISYIISDAPICCLPHIAASEII